jgi:hypothetical protein
MIKMRNERSKILVIAVEKNVQASISMADFVLNFTCIRYTTRIIKNVEIMFLFNPFRPDVSKWKHFPVGEYGIFQIAGRKGLKENFLL